MLIPLALALACPHAESPRPNLPRGEAAVTEATGAVLSFRLKNRRDDPVAWFTRRAAGIPGIRQSSVRRHGRLGVVDVRLAAGTDPNRAIEDLLATGACEFVEAAAPVDWLGMPDDPGFASQWHLYNTGQTGGSRGADVAAPWAFEIEDGAPSVVIATIDSGVDLHHPDLAGNLAWNPGEVADNSRDDDRNGFVDDACGFDFADLDGDVAPRDAHGTAVAGVIAASGNNGLGVTGLAGGGRDGVGCRLLPIRIGGSDATNAALDDAILYAVDQGARVIVLALATEPARAIDLALEAADAAGVMVVASAGNGGAVSYPARHPLVLAVGGTDDLDRGGRFSAGPEIDVAAPATDILTTNSGGGYATFTGTSFAAPQVAALAGLILSAVPSLAPAQVRSIVETTARPVPALADPSFVGHGRIDAWAALIAARRSIPPHISVSSEGTNDALTIATNGEPPLAGSTRFGLFGGGFERRVPVWLLVSGATPDGCAHPLAIPAFTDEFGEAEVRFDLPLIESATHRRFFAHWIGEPRIGGGTESSRVLAITIGSR